MSNKKDEIEFFNKDTSDNTRESINRLYSDIVVGKIREKFEEYIYKNGNNKKVLEIGCGIDPYAIVLAKNNADITGIDISDNSIRLAREHAALNGVNNINYLVMDAEKLEFDDKQFDLVFGKAILHHLDLEKSVGEIRRVLKSGGKSVFIEPLGLNPFINLFRRLTPGYRTKDEHPLTRRDLEEIAGKFNKVDFKYFFFLTLLAMPFARLKLGSWIFKPLYLLDRTLFKLLPFTKYLAWQVLIILEEPKH